MSKRQRKPEAPKEAPKEKGLTPLTGLRLLLAQELARHGIAVMLPDSQIVQSIEEQCLTTERSAQAALRAVAKQGAKLSPQQQSELSDMLHFRYEHLYAQAAQQQKLETAAKMLDRRARLAGLFTQQAKAPALPAEKVDEEFDGRSNEEIGFFASNGHWPEERPPANVIPIDPLAKIRKASK